MAASEKKTTTPEPTLTQKITDINNKALKARKDVADAQKATKLKEQIAATKSKRGPSNAGRVSGLGKLQPRLGKQFSKNDISDYLDA